MSEGKEKVIIIEKTKHTWSHYLMRCKRCNNSFGSGDRLSLYCTKCYNLLKEFEEIDKKYEENLNGKIICPYCNKRYSKYLSECSNCFGLKQKHKEGE